MGQRARILTEIWGYRGWKVIDAYAESLTGERLDLVPPEGMRLGGRLVLRVERRWAARCSHCGAIVRRCHEHLPVRRWDDLPWAGRPAVIEYEPIRVDCERCGTRAVEMLAWADPYQRQSRRLQQHLALQAASMPVSHVAAMHALSWSTVRRAEGAALQRWADTRPPVPLRHAGVDEKWLGRRHQREEKFVTIASNVETGEPIWMGFGRDEATLTSWLTTLSVEQKAAIELFVMDMHAPFKKAVRSDPALAHAPVVHDPFHIMKRAGEAISEIRKDTFFRAGPDRRAVGRGSRWLVLRAWERSNDNHRRDLRIMFAFNHQLARAYQINETLREVLRAPDRESIERGLRHVLRRTQLRRHVHLRKLHDSLLRHWDQIVALGEHRPATGRVEALNNNWETLVRRGRGYRDLDYLLLKLRFMIACPLRTAADVERFLALGITPPPHRSARKAA